MRFSKMVNSASPLVALEEIIQKSRERHSEFLHLGAMLLLFAKLSDEKYLMTKSLRSQLCARVFQEFSSYFEEYPNMKHIETTLTDAWAGYKKQTRKSCYSKNFTQLGVGVAIGVGVPLVGIAFLAGSYLRSNHQYFALKDRSEIIHSRIIPLVATKVRHEYIPRAEVVEDPPHQVVVFS